MDTGGLMSDAAQLPPEQRAAVAKALSDTGLPQVLNNPSSDVAPRARPPWNRTTPRARLPCDNRMFSGA